LNNEHAEAQTAITNAQLALRDYAQLVIEIAETAFPEQWKTLRPELPTIASWLGYDLDGRTDIHWSQSFAFRLREKAIQLQTYAIRIREIIGDASGEARSSLAKLVDHLDAAQQQSEQEAELFSRDLTEPDNLVAAANAITMPSDTRITSTAKLLEMLDVIIGGDCSPSDCWSCGLKLMLCN